MRSGLLQLRLLVGGGGAREKSAGDFANMVSIIGGPSTFGPYSSSSSVLLHLDMEELHDTDLETEDGVEV